tara:strand:- start:5919 stop:6566 length:648 start_codon:yes stop_codon:yes gene_type:complete
MPQTPQEKAIHASSKSNGNSNEVTSASMVKDDEPDSNNGTTNEKKKSWKSKFGFNYANEKRKNYTEKRKVEQEENNIKLKEFREKFKEIRNDDSTSFEKKNQKLDQLLGESGTFDKIKLSNEDEANIYKYKSYVEKEAKKEGGGSTTTKTTVGGQTRYENKINEAHRTMMANRENRAEENEEGEANKDESKPKDDIGIKLAMLRVGINPNQKSES